jgi:hypothetical protein
MGGRAGPAAARVGERAGRQHSPRRSCPNLLRQLADPFLAELLDCECRAVRGGLVAAARGLALMSLACHLDPFNGLRAFQPFSLAMTAVPASRGCTVGTTLAAARRTGTTRNG